MESLAFVVVLILISILSLGITAFVLSWFRNKLTRVLSYVFAGASIASGIWIGWTLIDGNGIAIATVPVLLGLVSIWNALRRKKTA